MSARSIATHRRQALALSARATQALVDQCLWSAGFFVFSALLAAQLPTVSFAVFAVATAIATVTTAIVRNAAVESVLIAPNISDRRAFERAIARSYLLMGGVTFLVVAPILLSEGVSKSSATMEAALAGVLVIQDGTRYVLLAYGNIISSLRWSITYASLAVIAYPVLHFTIGTAHGTYTLAFCTVTSALIAAGLLVTAVRKGNLLGVRDLPRAYAVRMGAEALYAGLGAQASVLLLSFFRAAEVIAGTRVAYTLAFGPGNLIVQGLHPHVLRRMSDRRLIDERSLYRGSLAWGVVSSSALVACGLGFAWLSPVFTARVPSFSAAHRYLWPVGLSIVGNAVLGAATLGLRFVEHPRVLHRMRLAWVIGDVVCLLVGDVIAGVSGLVTSLSVGGAIKVALGAGLIVYLRVRVPLGAPNPTTHRQPPQYGAAGQ